MYPGLCYDFYSTSFGITSRKETNKVAFQVL